MAQENVKKGMDGWINEWMYVCVCVCVCVYVCMYVCMYVGMVQFLKLEKWLSDEQQ
jgi:hypothetical protein